MVNGRVAESANNARGTKRTEGKLEDPGNGKWRRRRPSVAREKYSIRIIYIFYKYSLSWEKARPQGRARVSRGDIRGGVGRNHKRGINLRAFAGDLVSGSPDAMSPRRGLNQ